MSINTEEFLQTTTSEVLDDHLDPCPAGEFNFQAGKPEIADFEFKKGERKGETGYRMIVKWECLDDNVKKLLDRDKVTVTQSILLDMTNDNSGLDISKGKNIGLGQLRTALGQNVPGEPWSPAMIESQIASLKITHEIWDNNPVARIGGVSPAQ